MLNTFTEKQDKLKEHDYKVLPNKKIYEMKIYHMKQNTHKKHDITEKAQSFENSGFRKPRVFETRILNNPS